MGARLLATALFLYRINGRRANFVAPMRSSAHHPLPSPLRIPSPVWEISFAKICDTHICIHFQLHCFLQLNKRETGIGTKLSPALRGSRVSCHPFPFNFIPPSSFCTFTSLWIDSSSLNAFNAPSGNFDDPLERPRRFA